MEKERAGGGGRRMGCVVIIIMISTLILITSWEMESRSIMEARRNNSSRLQIIVRDIQVIQLLKVAQLLRDDASEVIGLQIQVL